MKSIKIFFSLVVLLLNASCLSEESLKLPFNGFLPKDISDGWIISDPDAEKIEAIRLAGIFADLHENDIWQIKSLLVFRNNTLVAESYAKCQTQFFVEYRIKTLDKI